MRYLMIAFLGISSTFVMIRGEWEQVEKVEKMEKAIPVGGVENVTAGELISHPLNQQQEETIVIQNNPELASPLQNIPYLKPPSTRTVYPFSNDVPLSSFYDGTEDSQSYQIAPQQTFSYQNELLQGTLEKDEDLDAGDVLKRGKRTFIIGPHSWLGHGRSDRRPAVWFPPVFPYRYYNRPILHRPGHIHRAGHSHSHGHSHGHGHGGHGRGRG